ncbi:hypothetical protein FO519_008039 [Halicephalobus sp. NKZ332]|nr:hypothetical protein FO519_008039 [Halicephalobus sp. NKZ332]
MPPRYSVSTITQTPTIEIPLLKKILEEVYGIIECEVLKLTGYDDLNFKIEKVKFSKNAHPDLVKRDKDIFIVKFMNPIENSNPYLLDGQVQLSKRLKQRGIPTPEPLPTVEGNLWQYVDMNDKVKLPIRLFTFLPGLMAEKIGYNDSVYFLLGTLLAEFHNATEDFDHRAYEDHYIFMCMENWDLLEEEFEVQAQQGLVKNERNLDLLKRGIADLRKDVLDKKDKFKKGFIHADVNETNVLLQKFSEGKHEITGFSNGKYKVTGLLDLGDAHRSLIIFDIATLILYLTVDSKVEDWRPVAKVVIEGYSSKRIPVDLDVILVSMRARLVSSLLYSTRTVRINYRNEDPNYILKMQENGWKVLEKLTLDYDNEAAKNKQN